MDGMLARDINVTSTVCFADLDQGSEMAIFESF